MHQHRAGSALSLIGVGDDAMAARAYAALGIHPLRAEILRYLLSRAEVSTADVMREFGLTRNGAAKHLKGLVEDGVANARRATHPRGAGPITYWTADRAELEEILEGLVGHVWSGSAAG